MTDADVTFLGRLARELQADIRTLRGELRTVRDELCTKASRNELLAIIDRIAAFEAHIDSRLDRLLKE